MSSPTATKVTRLVSAVVLVAAAAGLVIIVLPNDARPGRARARQTATPPYVVAPRTVSKQAARPLPVRFLAADGVESTTIRRENARPGTTDWLIPAGVSTSAIAGFADHVDAAPGDVVHLFVSARSARFSVEAFRMGFYGGAGARLVWRSAEVLSRRQPACRTSLATHMVSCANWSPSLTVSLTSQFVPGDYLLKLVSATGQGYVPLTVWDPTSDAAYVIKNDVYTWQAWNLYGGYDFYAGLGSCPPDVYPTCNRARVVSFDRPYAYGDGAGDFLGNEYPLVRLAEQQGLDVTYVTDLTIEQRPGLLLTHRALLSLGHDECWSLHERLALVSAENHGVNVAFFGASPILRHVRLEPSPLGTGRQEVDYRDSSADPLDHHGDPREVTGNTWGSPPASWPANHFVGAVYAGFLEPAAPPDAFVVAQGNAWIFHGTGLRTGSVLPGVLRSDFDQFDVNDHPLSEEVLGHSPISLVHAQSLVGHSRGGVYSDMTYYTDGHSDAGVFDSGTNNWIPALQCADCPASDIRIITTNLLWLFGQGPSAQLQPSHPNWQQVYGAR